MMKSGREYLPLYFFIGNFVEFSYKKIKPSGQECTAAEWNHVAEATRRRHRILQSRILSVLSKKLAEKIKYRFFKRERCFLRFHPGKVSKEEIHYIGGTEILPPPLETDRENEVIGELATDSAKEARAILIEHNLRLVVYIAKKFDNTGVGVEDLISIGTIGLIKSINTFNPEKNIKLATMHPAALRMKS